MIGPSISAKRIIDSQQRTIDALVAALEAARPLIISEWHDEHRVVKQIDAALALARA